MCLAGSGWCPCPFLARWLSAGRPDRAVVHWRRKIVSAKRFADMHLATTRVSAIRRSLAALLVDELRLLPGIAVDPRRRTKFSLAPAAEQRLTNWMTTHLQVTWILHPVPESFEEDIIKRLTPPLNYDYATKGPYAEPLQVHRDQLLARVGA
ncbi:GIY-YIG nuclease family protein [Arthrobacter sp. ATA002]|uniref:GIY-YIG nuclease family protein n=1 Tax=Arthrobacter sp. ATA002 TaxID=2991715 RepID=UPI003FA43572